MTNEFEYEGLWYNGNNLYKSKAFTKKSLRDFLENNKMKKVRLLVKHNKYWNETNNTPRYQFTLTDATESEIENDFTEKEEVENELTTLREDTERIMRYLLNDLASEDYSQAENTIYDYLQHWGM